MWIQHPRIGHLSICLARKAPGPGQPVDPDAVMIRARVRTHLENLIRACAMLKGHEIIQSQGTDYEFRIVCPKLKFADAMFDLVSAISWTNVKAEAAKHQADVGADFCDALHETWSAFHRIQSRS